MPVVHGGMCKDRPNVGGRDPRDGVREAPAATRQQTSLKDLARSGEGPASERRPE